jgi:hypothetical protein
MGRPLPSRSVFIGALALAGALMSTSGVLAQSLPEPSMTFTLTIDETQAVFGPEGFGEAFAPGQVGTEDAPVARDGETVGLALTSLTITHVEGDDVAGLIDCSIELPEGSIVFNGSFHFGDMASGVDIPVVGGTGDYASAIGTVTLTGSEDGTTTTLDFDIHQG